MTTKITWRKGDTYGSYAGADGKETVIDIEMQSKSPDEYIGAAYVSHEQINLHLWTCDTDLDSLKVRLESLYEKLREVIKEL
jgi:hypothetical protein